MTKSAVLLAIGAALAGFAVAAWIYRPAPAASNAVSEADVSSEAARPAPVVRAPPRAAMPAPQLPVSPEAIMAQQRQQALATSGQMERLWAADAADTTMAGVEQDIAGIARSPRVLDVREQPATIDAIACRASMCRIESTFANNGGGAEWSTRLVMEMAGTFATSTLVTLPGADGRNKVVLYAFKPGKEPRR